MVNVFISYCHADERIVNLFLRKTYPLHSGKNPICNIWRDRMMAGGDSISASIDCKIKETDLAILFLSEDFLMSQSCQDEVDKFIQLKEKRGLKILSLIVDRCLWREDSRLSDDLALTKDGQSFKSCSKNCQDDFWCEVITNFKGAIAKYRAEHPEIIRIPKNTKKVKVSVEFDINTDIELLIENFSLQVRNSYRELYAKRFNGTHANKIVYDFHGTSEEIYDILSHIKIQGAEKFISNITYVSEFDKFEREDLTIDETLTYLRN